MACSGSFGRGSRVRNIAGEHSLICSIMLLRNHSLSRVLNVIDELERVSLQFNTIHKGIPKRIDNLYTSMEATKSFNDCIINHKVCFDFMYGGK